MFQQTWMVVESMLVSFTLAGGTLGTESEHIKTSLFKTCVQLYKSS